MGIAALALGQTFRFLTRNLENPTYKEVRDSGDAALAWRSIFLSIKNLSWIGLLTIVMGLVILMDGNS